MVDLRGQVAMVTGGSRGVGLAVASRLAGCGAAVALVARDDGALQGARQQIEAAGGCVLCAVADVADPTAMAEAVQQTERELGGLDILVNNAGMGRYGPVEQFELQTWRRVLDTNLTGVFVATQAALPAIRRRGGGRIVAISSGAGKRGIPNMTAYCASKWGLHGFMEALAAELAGEPIRCTTIVPGSILTDFGVRTRQERLESGDTFLEPDDIAQAVAYVLLQPSRAWTQELNVWPR